VKLETLKNVGLWKYSYMVLWY